MISIYNPINVVGILCFSKFWIMKATPASDSVARGPTEAPIYIEKNPQLLESFGLILESAVPLVF